MKVAHLSDLHVLDLEGEVCQPVGAGLDELELEPAVIGEHRDPAPRIGAERADPSNHHPEPLQHRDAFLEIADLDGDVVQTCAHRPGPVHAPVTRCPNQPMNQNTTMPSDDDAKIAAIRPS